MDLFMMMMMMMMTTMTNDDDEDYVKHDGAIEQMMTTMTMTVSQWLGRYSSNRVEEAVLSLLVVVV